MAAESRITRYTEGRTRRDFPRTIDDLGGREGTNRRYVRFVVAPKPRTVSAVPGPHQLAFYIDLTPCARQLRKLSCILGAIDSNYLAVRSTIRPSRPAGFILALGACSVPKIGI